MSTPIGPYAPVRRVGDWVITSGQIGLAPGDGAPALVEGGTIPQLHQALANVTEVLGREGATLRNVVKTTLYLLDMAEFTAVNEVWVQYFSEPEDRPTRSAVAVSALPAGARVEVEAWAYAPAPAPAPAAPGEAPAPGR
jgi:2-iminobutanoate/2-iminopropanoate deaminase